MAVLDCTQIATAWVGGHEMAEIWAGGVRIWENATPRIADHYGIGPGQIAIHLNSDGATLDGAGRVTAIANAGGAGPVFNATISGAPIPLDGHLLQISASTGFPILANPADLLGVRLMWVSTVATVNATRYFGSIDRGPGGADYEIRTNMVGSTWTMQLWDNEGGTGASVTLTPRVAVPAGIHLLELDFAPSGVVTLYQDGVAISAANAAGAFSAFFLDRIGQGTSTANMFDGQMGDVLGVILGGTAADTIDTARAWLAQRYPALDLPEPEFAPAMMTSYAVPDMPALPTQLLPNPGLDDTAAWTAANGWSLDGEGATHASGSFSRLTANNVPLGAGTEFALSFEVPNQTSAPMTSGVRGTVYEPGATDANRNRSTDYQYHGWIAPHNVVPQVAHIYNRTAAQTLIQLDAGNSFAGSIRNPRLYDVSGIRTKLTVVLVAAGQSNCEGYGEGPIDVTLDAFDPHVWSCSPVNWNFYGVAQNVATIAQEPLIHCGSPGQKVGPAMPMARRLVSMTGGAIRVVIVPVAKSGTRLVGTDAHWNPDTTLTGSGNRLFDLAVATYAQARSQITNHIGTMMLWSQGEADWQVYGQYPAAFSAFLTRFKSAVSISDMPTIVAGRVIADAANPGAMVTMQRTLDKDSGHANAIPEVTYFDGPIGQQHINVGDTVHFNTPAQRVRGDYAGQLAYVLGRARGWWT